MIVSSAGAVSSKYRMLEQSMLSIKQGEVAMSKNELDTYNMLVGKLTSEPVKGLIFGLSTPVLCGLNKSSFKRMHILSKICLVGSGPVMLPILFRLHTEYKVQNFLLYMKWKQITGEKLSN